MLWIISRELETFSTSRTDSGVIWMISTGNEISNVGKVSGNCDIDSRNDGGSIASIEPRRNRWFRPTTSLSEDQIRADLLNGIRLTVRIRSTTKILGILISSSETFSIRNSPRNSPLSGFSRCKSGGSRVDCSLTIGIFKVILRIGITVSAQSINSSLIHQISERGINMEPGSGFDGSQGEISSGN